MLDLDSLEAKARAVDQGVLLFDGAKLYADTTLSLIRELREARATLAVERGECADPAVWAWTIEDGRLHAWTAPPYLDRVLLRRVVDAAWITATESSEVPASEWADRIIESVLSNGVGDPTETNNAVRLTKELAQMRYLLREMVGEMDLHLASNNTLCQWHTSWLARAHNVIDKQIRKEGQP